MQPWRAAELRPSSSALCVCGWRCFKKIRNCPPMICTHLTYSTLHYIGNLFAGHGLHTLFDYQGADDKEKDNTGMLLFWSSLSAESSTLRGVRSAQYQPLEVYRCWYTQFMWQMITKQKPAWINVKNDIKRKPD